ncbi:hypothetical protein C5C31_14605 [Rathayibacter rathayi]|uniref:DUF304 domain-containing protein n=1 Tax=Rathayibacter rathayi TaxID=33887 RepID=A0ABD6WBV0_RATRA|nr:hypothetical protein [Rathayibacter rathayi]PPF15910.1 hypothetical protein C5C04_01435 [Rathayibacter rathayi]PPF19091.1 hypothetical protein C5C34_15170 [Rathayibacter rathayi]PPG90444.1 hypothetical protein C5C22_14985 [Rathayibacter rathayi]PPH17301.1 hypothetical protein C5C31_14605 [Rathayibacter rathayi]
MFPHFSAATIAIAAAAAVPATVRFVVRRRDRAHPDERIAAAPDDAVVLSFRRWQSVLTRVTGILVAAVSALMDTVAMTRPGETGMLIAGLTLTVIGVPMIGLASGIARFRVTLRDDRIDVVPMAGRPRSVPLRDIARITPAGSRYGGLSVYDVRRKRLFSVTTITLGFPHLVPFLQWNAPLAWEEFARKHERNFPVILGPAAPRPQER